MVTVITSQGRRIEVIYQSELCDPLNMGEYVRAYCHIHGSDHQRSLSIHKETGWGRCFNAACEATVLVAEWNPTVAQRMLHAHEWRGKPLPLRYTSPSPRKVPPACQPSLLTAPSMPQKWQREELVALRVVDRQMRLALVRSKRARAYLHERGIPLEVATTTGVGYLSPAILDLPEVQMYRKPLQRWVGRIVFPLTSPIGRGYIGRSLWHWQSGMDENTHKALLDQPERPRRWIKTNPAGWYGYEFDQLPGCLILVEGAFDRLTLLTAGFPAGAVVALVGTATRVEWYPAQVRTVILALDADEGGQEATTRLKDQLQQMEVNIKVCPPVQDRWGKDWNERWRRLGPRSMQLMYKAFAEACCA